MTVRPGATVMANNSIFAANFADAAGDSIYNEGENGSAPASFANAIFEIAVPATSSITGTHLARGKLSNDGGGFNRPR
jgi:hypothetical protein